ncbi:Scr1 family TA system antitoxin-like transcriptional regulator [Streptomyces sp. NPDC127098]|uniref:helix-turn-helix domain-containing protein n=1 Tax=Streptomyces sp. NPDC127098 TaxID=3347137 RepID=UPI00365B3DBD
MTATVNTNAIFAMRDVGENLQQLRTRAGLRQDDAAVRLNVTRYTISKIERGKAFPTEHQLRALVRLYRATVEERAALKAKIEHGRSYGRAWWEQLPFRNLFQGDSYRYFYVEDAAERICHSSGTYVPGLLQAKEYIEAIAAFGQKQESAERREVFVEARLRRQAILHRRNPVSVDLLCLESALRAVVGGPEVMRRQLRLLLELGQHSHIGLRVVPHSTGAPSIHASPFTVLDFPGTDNRSVVSQETISGETLSDDPADVRRARRKFADLAEHALGRQETLRRIEEIERELT